ncbi:MAG TPA: SDR family oxidoreductase [Candidatus Limnocylindrales bacterium]|nr:SDR family oxidoreductase [Candidatus Limnocylindrales bacterium]
MILVTGATGLVGGAVVRELAARGVPVRALVRSPEKAAALAGPTVEAVVGDFARPESLDQALQGVTRALLISHHDARQVELQGNFVEAARRAGSVHVVKLSGLGTAPDSSLHSGRWHAETETQIRKAGLPWTFLHPPYFMQNLLRAAPAIASHGVLTAAMKDGRIAMVDARDVAAVAAAALTTDGHAEHTYVVTGPEALSHLELAAILGKAVGRPITYREISLDAFRGELTSAGVPPWLVDVRVEFSSVLRENFAATVTDIVPRVTGRAARTFAAFAAEHAARFGG